MSGIYFVDLIDVLAAAGVPCAVTGVNAGWETRARSSGGFPDRPLAVFWHHTASSTDPESDLSWMIHGSDDAPIGNMLLDRDGVVWPIAAGASNCAGKGGPMTFSRGVIPLDSGNTRGWQIEVANNGVGERWPQVQIDAYFRCSNALNARFGNEPYDVTTHRRWAPDRKIDPATAAAVEGPWRPSSETSSGTWDIGDIWHECHVRALPATEPEPPEPPPLHEEIPDMLHVVVLNPDGTPNRGPAIIGPGYWHYSAGPDEAFVWAKLWGPPRVLDNGYDFDLLVRTIALEPADDRWLGPDPYPNPQ